MKLIIESASPETAFDIDNPGRYVEDYLYKEMVGKVPSHDYFKFEKLRDGKITWMTGDEYIDKCINDIFNLSYDQVVTRAVNEDKVNEYAEKMLNGVTFPVCYLDYPYRQQEGRHRALAFKKAFGENAKMPVLEIFDATKENVSAEEILDYCVRRWNAHYDFFFPNIASNFGISEKEINKLLGRESDEDEFIENDEDEFIENQDDVYEDDLDNLDDEILLDDPDDTTFDW